VAASSPEPRLAAVATYERVIRASLGRIWENVLDWEHLPWLHRTSFLDVTLRDASDDGWRARVRLPPAARGRESEIDVRLDRPALSYLTRTVDGFGTGTEILTRLAPLTERATRITVDFRVPGVDGRAADAIGAAYVRTYAQLWDEDEAMMVRRQALLDATRGPRHAASDVVASEVLGRLDDLRSTLPLGVEWDGRLFRLVEIDGALVLHATTCPHLGGPLAAAPIEDGCVTCPWHGYRFDIRTGANVDGRACGLDDPPRLEVDAAGVVRVVFRSRPSVDA
jgi:nitrite reductase/ring-hydroxylating ferredoxin subunit